MCLPVTVSCMAAFTSSRPSREEVGDSKIERGNAAAGGQARYARYPFFCTERRTHLSCHPSRHFVPAPLNRRGNAHGLPIFGNRTTGNIDALPVQQFHDVFV